MQKDFEGRTEQEAIDKAISELGLDRDQFDVEILGKEKKSFFRKGNVRIRVYYGDEAASSSEEEAEAEKEAQVEFIGDEEEIDLVDDDEAETGKEDDDAQ